jgi:hypothetical protein
MKKQLLLSGLFIIAAVILSGCSAPKESLLDQVSGSPLIDTGFKLQTKPAESCGESLFGCSQPLYEAVYQAPANVAAAQVCNAFVDTAFQFGKPTGFGPEGQKAGSIPKDVSKVKTFCVESLGTERTSIDGSFKYYEGLLIVDDGESDQLGKNWILRRDGEGKYQAILGFSRDLPRVSWPTESKPPKHSYGSGN